MNQVKTTVSKVTSNPVGAIVGGIAGFYAVKKLAKTENKWYLAGGVLVGAIVGSLIQSKISAKASAPTAATVKK